MISHVVLLKPRPDLSIEERHRFIAAFERAARAIPAVRAVRIGRRVVHGAGYEATMPDAAAYVAILDFDDVRGLQIYLEHPAHEELGRLFASAIDSAWIYDFEVGGLDVLGADGFLS